MAVADLVAEYFETDLVRATPTRALDQIQTWLAGQLADQNEAVVDGQRLLALWPAGPGGRLANRDSAGMAGEGAKDRVGPRVPARRAVLRPGAGRRAARTRGVVV